MKINKVDFNFELFKVPFDLQSLTEEERQLKERLHFSMVELVREKNQSLAALLQPDGMSKYFNE